MTSWLLERGADPNTRCARNCTPLSFAVCSGPASVVNLLIDACAGDIKNGQLLHHATQRPSVDRLIMVRKLLRLGADPNELAEISWWPHSHRIGGGTPLHCAAEQDDSELALLLLAWGADPSISDFDGRKARRIAQKHKNRKLARALRPAGMHIWWWILASTTRRWYWHLRLKLRGLVKLDLAAV